MVEVIAVIMTFGLPMYIVKTVVAARNEKHRREHEAKLLMLRGGGASTPALEKEVEDLRKERKLLVERIENLESIVCSVDYELNQKVARLLEEQRSVVAPADKVGPPALPAPAVPAPAAGAGAAPAAGKPGARGEAALGATLTAAPGVTPGGGPPAAEQPSELRVGSVLANRYRVQKLLGRGGMGAVYLCDDEVLGELVALKVISNAWAADREAMTERFKREAQAARKVSSPSVIRIHDLGEAPPRFLYLSMEYFPGRTLSQVIAQRGLVPMADCKDYLGQICEGLAAAHDVGVVHRDLKPGNVLVGERSAVKIIDFGLAKATAAEGLTATGALLGTPHYMAPEQIRGKNVDARADLYSLGALAFHLLTGRPPFAGDNPISVGFAHLSEPAPSARALRPDVPEALDKMVTRALAKDPAERPADARAFREALR